jgi:hypothetical protein
MTKRLLDEPDLEAADRQLANLFRAAAPFELNEFRKRRVLLSLERGQRRARSRVWLRAVAIAALLVTGSAAAAIGHRYASPGSFLFGLVGSRGATVAPRKVAPSVVAAPDSSLTGSAELDRVEAVPLVADAPVPTQPAPKSSLRVRAESSEDATDVVEAIQALRTERDPSRAQALLNDYLKSHPHGVLSGDALALSIEAASAQHDPRAADYARRYLAAFPRGKYRDLANRALAGARAPSH